VQQFTGVRLPFLGGGRTSVTRAPRVAPQGPFLPPGSRVQFPTPGVVGGIQRFLPGGASGFTTVPPSLLPGLPRPVGPGGVLGALGVGSGGVSGFAAAPSGNGACPSTRGTHLNRSGYYVQTQPGNPGAGGTWVPAESMCVANRRRNNFNANANRRALSRLTALAKNVHTLKKSVRTLNRAIK